MFRCCVGGKRSASNPAEAPASKSQDGASNDDKPSIAIEVVSMQGSTKWISEGRKLHDEVPVENSPTDQLWNLQREDTLLLWSFYLKKDGKKLFVTYEKDGNEVRLEYDGPGVNRMFTVAVSPKGLIIGTKEEDRHLGKKNGLLSLYPPGDEREAVEWDFLYQHVSQDRLDRPVEDVANILRRSAEHNSKTIFNWDNVWADFHSATDHVKTEIRDGDWKWKSTDPFDNEAIVVESGESMEQEWNVRKITNSGKDTYFEIFVDQGSSTLYAAYDTDLALGVAFRTDVQPAYRQFKITRVDGYVFRVYIQRKPDPSDFTTYVNEETETRDITFCTDERWAKKWIVFLKYFYAGKVFFPPYHVTSSSDQQQTALN